MTFNNRLCGSWDKVKLSQLIQHLSTTSVPEESLIKRCSKCALKDSQRVTRPEELACNRPWTYSGGCLRRSHNSLDGHILDKRISPNEYNTLCGSRRFLGDSRSDVFTNKASERSNEKAEGAVPKYINRSQNLVWLSKSTSYVPQKTTSDLDTTSKKTPSSVFNNSSENRLQKNEDAVLSQKGKTTVPEYAKTNYPIKTPVKESKAENILMTTKAINSGQDKACTRNQLHNTIPKVCLDKTTKHVGAASRLPKCETSIEAKSKRSDLDLNKKNLPVESFKERQTNHSYVFNPKTENKGVPHLNNQKTFSERKPNTSEGSFSKEKTNIITFQKMPENKDINLRTKSSIQCETTQSPAEQDKSVLQKIIDIKRTQVILKGDKFTEKNKIKPKIWPRLYSEKMEDNQQKKDQACINDFKHKIEAYTRRIDLKKNTEQPQNTLVRAFGALNKTVALIKPDHVTRTETKSKRIIKSHNVESVLLNRRKTNGAKDSLPFSKIPMTAPTRSAKLAPLKKDSGINLVSKTNSVVSNPKYFAIQEFMAKNKAKLRSSIKKYIEGKKKLLTYNLKDEIEDWKKASSIQKKLQETKSKLRKTVAQKSGLNLSSQKKGNIMKKKKRFRPNTTSIPLKKTQLLKDDAPQLQNDIKKAHSEASNLDSRAMSTDAFNVLTEKYSKTLFKTKSKTFKEIVREKEMKKVREKFDEAPIQVMQRNLELEASQNEENLRGSESWVGEERDQKLVDSMKPEKPKNGVLENSNKMLDLKILNKKALFKNVNDNFGKQRLESKSSYTIYPSGCLKKPELLLETMTLKHKCVLPLPNSLSLKPQTLLKEKLGNVELLKEVGSNNDLGANLNKGMNTISANEITKLPEERKEEPLRETISKKEISSGESSDFKNRFASDKVANNKHDNPVKHNQYPMMMINHEYDKPIDNNPSMLTISEQSSTSRKKYIQNTGDYKIKEQEQTPSIQENYYEPQSEFNFSLGGDNLPKEMAVTSTSHSKQTWLSPLDEDRHIQWEDSDLKSSIENSKERVTHKDLKTLNAIQNTDGVINELKETTNIKEGVDQVKSTSVIMEKEPLNMSKSQKTGSALEKPAKEEKHNFLKNPVKNSGNKILQTETVHSARTTASNQEIAVKPQKSITENTQTLMSASEEILKNVHEDNKTENCINHQYKSRNKTIRNSDKTDGSSFYNFLYRFFNDTLDFKSNLQPLPKRNISSNPSMNEDLKNYNNEYYKNFLSTIFLKQAPTQCEHKHSIKSCNETLGNDASCNNTISKKASESKPRFFGLFSDVLKSMKSDNVSIASGNHECDNIIKGNRETCSDTQNEIVKKKDSNGNADDMNSTNAPVIPIKMDSTSENIPKKDTNVNKTDKGEALTNQTIAKRKTAENKTEALDKGLPEGLHEESYVSEKIVPRVLTKNHLRTENIVEELLERYPQLSKLNEESAGSNSRIPTLVLKSHQKSNLIKQEHEIIKIAHIGMPVEKTVAEIGTSVVHTKGEGSKEDCTCPVKNSLQKEPKDQISNSQSENLLQNKSREIFSKNGEHSSNDTKSNVSRTECQKGDSTLSRHIDNSVGVRVDSSSRKVENSQYQEPKPSNTEGKGKFSPPSETSTLFQKGIGKNHENVESKPQGIPESHMPKSTLHKLPPKSKTEGMAHNTSTTPRQDTLHVFSIENKRDIVNNSKENCQRENVEEDKTNKKISVNKDPLLEALKNLCLQYEGAVDNYKSKTQSISVKPEQDLTKKSEWNYAEFINLWEPSKSIYTDSLCTRPFKLPKKKGVSSGNKENTNLNKRKRKLDKEELKSHRENVSSNLKSSKFIFSKKRRTDKMKSKEKCLRLKEVPNQKRRKGSNLMRDLLTAKDGILSLLQWENKMSRTPITNPELFWNGTNTEYNSNDVLNYIKNKR